jgi:hypothetical protein
MRLDPIADSLDVAPGNVRVDEVVAAASRQVVLGEAESQEVVAVVVEHEVVGHVFTRDSAGFLRVGVEKEALLGRQQWPLPERLPGEGSVLDGDEVRMRPQVRSAASSSILGPSAASTRAAGWAGSTPRKSAASIASRYVRIVSIGDA